MEFYQVLAQYYDEIFPLKEPQKKFLRDYMSREELTSILDVGCGTGSYTLEISNWGFRTWGIDLSREMIELARQKAEAGNSTAQFIVGDMRDLSGVPGTFDGIICLGNTLVHLTKKAWLEEALRGLAAKAGKLLIQIVNYDRILAKNVTELPEIRTPNLTFRRYYQLAAGLIRFSMEIELLGQHAVLSAVNQLMPLTREELEQVCAKAGWVATDWWGSFGGEPWSPETTATVVALTKTAG